MNGSQKINIPARALPAAALIGAVCLVCLVYAQALKAPFLFDDDGNITENPHIRMTRLTPAQAKEVLKSRSANRPVANFTLAVNYYLHRYEVTGYRLVNLAVHLINGLLVFLLARHTLRLLGRDGRAVPYLTAVLWLVNPVHIQSVTYIVQRMNSLAALFCLLALYLYICARTASNNGGGSRRSGPLFLLSFISGLLALGSKENAATLPLMILLYEWFFFQNLSRSFLKKQLPWVLAAALIIAAAALVFMGRSPLEKISAGYDDQPFTLEERLLTQPRVIVRYLTLLMLPLPERLSIVHDVPLSTSLFHPPTTLAALIFLVLAAAAAIMTAGQHRLFAFSVFWFLGTLAVESSFIGLAMMFEHRTYLPSVFLFIAAVDWLSRTRPTRLGRGTLLILIAVSAVWTWQRNGVWNDKPGFWQDAVRKAPFSYRAYNNLSVALGETERYREGIEAGRRSISLAPPMISTARQHSNIGFIYLELGDNDTALEYCRQALRMEPDFAEGHLNMGKILAAEQRFEEAVPYLEKAIALAPRLMSAYIHLAEVLHSAGRIESALDVCRRALDVDPEYLEAEYMMGRLWLEADEPGRARDHFTAVLRARPDHGPAAFQAGLAAYRLEEYQAAAEHFSRAAAMNPDNARTRARLGLALSALNRIEEAEASFLRYLELAGEDPVMLARLAGLEEERGQPGRAAGYYRRALVAAPDSARLRNRLAMALAADDRYREAEEELRELARLLPEAPTIDFNLACILARQGKIDQALFHLQQAVDKGFSDLDALRTSPDLDGLRAEKEYDKIIEQLQNKP